MSALLEGQTHFKPFELHQVSPENKEKYSLSILKTPTAIFSKTPDNIARSSKRLTFADETQPSREGSADSSIKQQNGCDDKVEIAISPVTSIKVSPEAWKAHQAYRRFKDYPNETVKTDYAYSRVSTFYKREILPGIPMRPNMSRLPIRSTQSAPPATVATPTTSRHFAHSTYNSLFSKSVSRRWRSIQKGFDLDDTRRNSAWSWIILLVLIIGLFFLQFPLLPSSESHLFKPNQISLDAFLVRLDALENAVHKEVERYKAMEAIILELQKIPMIMPAYRRCCLWSSCHYNDSSYIKIAQEAPLLLEKKLHDFRRTVEAELVEMSRNVSVTLEQIRTGFSNKSILSSHFIQFIVGQRLKLYDADKTALPDFALESAGGRVASIRCTQPWPGPEGVSYDPRQAIRKGVAPGQCWAFQGVGHLVIELAYPVRGLRSENDSQPHDFGNFTYQTGPDVDSVQYFPVINHSSELFQFVEFVVLTNHGYHYTCLYRVRIHGTLQ